jgi:DNA primase
MPKKSFSFEKIREHLDIVEVVSQYVNLKRSGVNFTALCPFHTEKTPSFIVSPQKQIYHCFGCGKGGDVIKFVGEINGLDYYDAAVKLAKDYNLEFDFKESSKINDFFEITKTAAEIFHSCLKNNINRNKVKNFIKNRKLTEDVLEKFFIGYAPENSQFLIKEFKKKHIDLKLACEIGIIKKEQNYYDTFRDRIIFPIRNLKGEFIAFGGRILNNKIQPKYLNSPDSLIYHKRKNLYGLFENRESVKKENEVIIVEGYMDLISLYSNNVKNVAATLGTAFTAEQLNLITRFTDNIIFLYDGDKAGIRASIKASIIAINKDLNPKIIYLPNNNDPDDFINKNGYENFVEIKNKADNLVNFLKNIIFSSIDLKNLENRIKLMDRLKKIYFDIDNPLYKDHFIKGCSEILNLDYNEVKRYITKSTKFAKYFESTKPETVKIKLEEEIVGIVLKDNVFLERIEPEFFQNNTYKKLVNLLKDGKSFNDILESDKFSEEERYYLRYLALNNKFEEILKNEREINRLFNRLKRNYFENKLKNLTNQIKEQEKNSNTDAVILLIQEQKNILNEIKKLD